jgi:glycine cleavage system H lipoate-binding protein
MASERQTSADKLYTAKIDSASSINNNPLYTKLLLIAIPFVLFFVFLNIASRYRKNKIIQVPVAGSGSKRALGENSLIIPNGLYFDKTHTWAFMEQNGLVKVGLDDFLQHITGTITRIKMKNAGDTFKKGEEILSLIQCGKQLNLYAPVSGIIRERNKALDTNASIINSSPYNDGWVYRIEPTNWLRENQLLFMAEKQKQFLKNEFSRLKDFLAVALRSDDNKYAQVVLQDGGELIDGTLSDLGPEIWEDFQSKFIDPSRQIWFYELF